jgi:hypothetical protein
MISRMIERDYVLKFLQNKQEVEGGYTGNDLTELAELFGVTSRGVRKRISNWIKNDKEFQQLIYLGKEKPSITLFEFLEIEQRFSENPAQVKKISYAEIQTKRDSENL